MKSPLFIWKLDITRSKSDMNEFIISKDENSSAEINKVLLMQLLSDDKTNLSDVYDLGKDEDESILTFEKIKNILSEINKKLKIEYSEEFKIEKFPENAEKIDKRGKEAPFIFYGGATRFFLPAFNVFKIAFVVESCSFSRSKSLAFSTLFLIVVRFLF